MAEVGTPVGYLRVLKDIFTLPIQRNVIKGTFATDDIKRTIKISKDISVNSLKVAAKKYKATVFEICHTMVSQTIKEYSRRHGDREISEITVISTFATKPPPRTKEELEYGNGFVPLFLKMPISDDFKSVLKASKHNIRDHIGSNKMKGMDRMIWSLLNLPYNQGKRVLNYMT